MKAIRAQYAHALAGEAKGTYGAYKLEGLIGPNDRVVIFRKNAFLITAICFAVCISAITAGCTLLLRMVVPVLQASTSPLSILLLATVFGIAISVYLFQTYRKNAEELQFGSTHQMNHPVAEKFFAGKLSFQQAKLYCLSPKNHQYMMTGKKSRKKNKKRK